MKNQEIQIFVRFLDTLRKLHLRDVEWVPNSFLEDAVLNWKYKKMLGRGYKDEEL